MDLKGTVALVTGGNGGLGQRICHALAREGAHIAVMYAQSRDQAEEVARELASRYQINAVAFACDITDGGAVDKLVEQIFGQFDPAKRLALLTKLNETMNEEAALIFVAHDLNPRGLSPKVHGFVQAQSWFQDLTPVSVDP